MKRLYKIWTLFFLLPFLFQAQARAHTRGQDAVLRIEAGTDPLAGLLVQTGIWEGASSVPADYYADSNVKSVFTRNKDLRNNMPATLPNDFNSVIDDIHKYIESNNSASDEKNNGLLNSELSKKIVRASFCFGTDPKMIAAKIRMESVFSKGAISPTGAVGFTQMTKAGLEEANDQLGNRGPKNAPAANAGYFMKAIRCYTGASFKTMWDAGVIKKGQGLDGSRLAAAKKWIRADVDRDLIYGQIVLKVNLAATRSGSKGMLDNYAKAFVRYNGDNSKVGKTQRKYVYSNQVMGYFHNIDYRPEMDAEVFPEGPETLEI